MSPEERIAYQAAHDERQRQYAAQWAAKREARLQAKRDRENAPAYDQMNPDTWPVGPVRRVDWDKPDYETITYAGEGFASGHFGD